MTSPRRLVLASGSPRRRELLTSIGLRFDVSAADADETELPGEPARDYVERVAALKGRAVVSRMHGPDLERAAVLAADTTVDLDGEILAKPIDDDDARHMLGRLSGRSHRVHTAVFGWSPDGEHTATVTTVVTFASLTDTDIEWYLSIGEHRDKAGAYGMQGAGGALVQRIDGSPSNVIGLPLAETVGVLRACGVAATGG